MWGPSTVRKSCEPTPPARRQGTQQRCGIWCRQCKTRPERALVALKKQRKTEKREKKRAREGGRERERERERRKTKSRVLLFLQTEERTFSSWNSELINARNVSRETGWVKNSPNSGTATRTRCARGAPLPA